MYIKKLKGFGLIEFVIVFAIIAIGATLTIKLGKSLTNQANKHYYRQEYLLVKKTDYESDLFQKNQDKKVTIKENKKNEDQNLQNYLDEFEKENQ